MKKVLAALLGLGFGLMGLNAMAASAEEMIRQNLQKIDPRIAVKSVADGPAGMKEVELASGEVIYVDSKGEYFLLGQLFRFTDAEGFVNLTEEKSKATRVEQLAQVPAEDKIVFAPAGEVKTTLTIFTDVDCPYCRKLHEEVPKLNEMGVQVDYLAFPRNGPNSKTFQTMVSIWCAGDAAQMQAAMTTAKTGGELEAKTCDNPVLGQLALGQAMGVTGTPAMVTADGTLVPGYVTAERLGKMLGL